MPTFVVPHRSGAHRVAAIALYRSLLTQCKRIPLPAVHGEELYNLVKNRFRTFRHNTSHRQLKVAFEAGYAAVDYLDAAITGDAKAKDYMLALLKRAPRNAKIDPRESPKQFLRRHYASDVWPDHVLREEKASLIDEDASQKVGSQGTEKMQLVQPFDSAQELAQHFSPIEAHEVKSSTFANETQSGTQSSGEGNVSDGSGPFIIRYASSKPKITRHLAASPSNWLALKPLSEDERLSQAIFGPPQSDFFYAFRKVQGGNPPIPRRNILFDPPIAKEDLRGTGIRQVPVLVNANGIPFLRYKKPMPANLASFINSRIEQRARRHQFKQEMEHILYLAQEEDKWDSIVYNTTGIDSRERGCNKVLWKNSAEHAIEAVTALLKSEKEKNRVHAEKLQAIVDREAGLARLELEEGEIIDLGGTVDDITDQERMARPEQANGECGVQIRYLDWDASVRENTGQERD
ncbi:hypothetical protein AC578_8772 [Pseudocercospora eumusae]|uniref:Complex 1 LYR protein domain-containing protein n=1 Tax=Pseudocercospora eumusae TaxID=321146 RepID=A0A139H6G6_9PEZI|nr:hypothetical protein AC578_8772 [Pseudocercospora eumusae]